MPSGLRVHGGSERGRRLAAPRNVRPSQGVVKEAVFNMLGPLNGERVLDLFAGSGALGIEALSRGAVHATFVERDERAAGVVRRNLEALGYRHRSAVMRAEATSWLRTHVQETRALELALVDPPYNDAVLDRALLLLDEGLPEGAVVVVEHAATWPLPPLRRLSPRPPRRYGDTAITLLEAATPP